MEIIRRTETPYERQMNDVARATIVRNKAVLDYNLMMENIEDPAEDIEEGEE